MKKLKIRLLPLLHLPVLFLLIAATLSPGCRELATPEPAQGKPVSNQMTAIVADTIPWTAVSLEAVRTSSSMTISGTSFDGKTITIYIEEQPIGQINLGENSSNFATYVDDSAKLSYKSNVIGGQGFVTITGIDEVGKTVSGRFSFVAKNSSGDVIRITEGKFLRVSYTLGTASGDEKEVSAKVNGVAWTADNVFAVASDVSGQLSISGYKNDNTSIGLLMPTGITAGTYTIEMGGTYSAQYNKGTDILGAITGTLIITEHNTGTRTIEGEFSFEAELQGDPDNAATITEGFFSVVYD